MRGPELLAFGLLSVVSGLAERWVLLVVEAKAQSECWVN